MYITTEELIVNGKLRTQKIIHVDDKEIIVSENFIKLAQLREEWDVDVEDPEAIISELKDNKVNADIFTFIQRLPYSKPKFNYHLEWDNVAALPIRSYEDWFKNRLHQNPRNKIRIAQKKGVELRLCEFNDELINGITRIYNETPVRQGKPFPDYGATFEETKKGHSTFLERACFVGAFFKSDLIGFVKLVTTDRYMRTMGILALTNQRDKAPMNLLIAKAAEICAEKKMPYLVYGKYKYGKRGSDTLQEFKRYLGFESIELPRYFIPMTAWGRIILKLKLHEGLIGIIPERLMRLLLNVRKRWYTKDSVT